MFIKEGCFDNRRLGIAPTVVGSRMVGGQLIVAINGVTILSDIRRDGRPAQTSGTSPPAELKTCGGHETLPRII